MKNNLHIFFILIVFHFYSNTTYSQQINVNSNVSVENLIRNNLIKNNSCVTISNVTSSINGQSSGFPSFAEFSRSSSNFPFESGIMLSTGSAESGGNGLNTTPLNDGNSSSWGTDPDIEQNYALDVNNTLNATSIEFDLTSIAGILQFKYILASEEYLGNFPCVASDGFVFLIKEQGSTDDYRNIAIVPGTTNTTAMIKNIHNEITTNSGSGCPAVNDQYFRGLSLGDTNYNGRTNELIASTTITPNTTYHIKLIIADHTDYTYDSAVFIQGDSFKVVDLGPDINTCLNETSLNADIQNTLATYKWFRDGIEIPNETDAILNNINISGLYRVEVTVSGCTEPGEINVNLNVEEVIDDVDTYQLCDDNNDGTESFDLTFWNSNTEAVIPFPNWTYTYHLTETLAKSSIDPGVSGFISSSINNPQTIWVRVQNTDTGCLGYTSFLLEVLPPPTVTTPSPINECDLDNVPDGRTLIRLTERDDEIIDNRDLSVTYHLDSNDLTTGDNPITAYINDNPSETIYLRVVDNQTGCVNIEETLTVNITNRPTVDIDPVSGEPKLISPLDACDRDDDGEALFNLTNVLTDLGDLTAYNVTFHRSNNNARDNIDAIESPEKENYINENTIDRFDELFIRIENPTTGCYTIVPFEVHTNLLLTGTRVFEPFALCNTQTSNGTINFDFGTIEQYIINGLDGDPTDPTDGINIQVTFYETEEDRDGTTETPITTPSIPVDENEIKTLYLKLESDTCTERAEIDLLVNPILIFEPDNPVPYCQTDGTIELARLDDIVRDNNDMFNVRYFGSKADAENGNTSLELDPFYVNTMPIETLYARIQNQGTQCVSINEFKVEVISSPEILPQTPRFYCDNTDGNPDGIITIDLNTFTNDIVNSTNNLIIDYFTTQPNDAQTTIDIIPEGDSRQFYNLTTQIIYARVKTNDDLECFNSVELDFTISTEHVFPTIQPYQICVDDASLPQNFTLADKDLEILNGETDKRILYFSEEIAAQNRDFNHLIDKSIPYNSGSKTIYVRVESILNQNCFNTDSFTIQVSENPKYNTNFDKNFPPLCQNSEGIESLSIQEKRQEISQNHSNLNIDFYLTEDIALNPIDNSGNPITPLPNIYTPQTLQGQIYARIENASNSCVIIEELVFISFAKPLIISTEIAPICDSENLGQVIFNLESNTLNIDPESIRFVDPNNIEISYYEDSGLTNEITTANYNYLSNSKDIYIKVENTETNCFDSAPLSLIMQSPPEVNDFLEYIECQMQTNTFDLTLIDNIVVDDRNIVNITYHYSEAGANNDTDYIIGSSFNYTIPGDNTIGVRIENPNTGCYTTTSFVLKIRPNPIANKPTDLYYCDNNTVTDDQVMFNLLDTEVEIRGALQPEANFSLSFYDNESNALAGTSNTLPTSYLGYHQQIIYARIKNEYTKCYDITDFTLNINAKPIITLRDNEPLCDNEPRFISAETGVFGDTYRWTDANGTEIGSNASKEFTTTDLNKTFNLEITRPNILGENCNSYHSFTLIPSQTALINDFTPIVHFKDPNSITIDIDQSRIGDYVYILDGGEEKDSNIFNDVAFGAHIVTVRDRNGCMDISKNVFVFDVPKFVTPNNDANFDTWHIIGVNQLPGTIVYIYNRQGKLLKTLLHTSIGWDGTYNGQNMPSDDYWFSADVMENGNAYNIQGHFTLKR